MSCQGETLDKIPPNNPGLQQNYNVASPATKKQCYLGTTQIAHSRRAGFLGHYKALVILNAYLIIKTYNCTYNVFFSGTITIGHFLRKNQVTSSLNKSWSSNNICRPVDPVKGPHFRPSDDCELFQHLMD